MTKLTAIVLTHNEERHVEDCLASLDFADERIVFDSESTDKTVELARKAGARVITHPFQNFSAQRNAALDAVSGTTDWVLFVDADERVTSELAEEIRNVIMRREYVGYQIPRDNYIFGKLTRGAGWHPDYQTRLLKVGKAHYENAVHEVVKLDGTLGTLTHPFVHYNYRDIDHFREKQRKYVRYDAQGLYDTGIKPKPQNFILQPLRQFRWRFFELGGYRDGLHGFRLSLLMAWYEYKKYRALEALWQQNGE
ncbi:MAG: glycosyltransferase family 2 protein [Chloroflexota bacterium]